MNIEIEQMLKALYDAISESDGRWQGRFGELLLQSHFQPIYSLPHRRPVGYEGLVRVMDPGGRPMSPVAAFEHAASFDEQVMLDRLCRLLHVHNFLAQQLSDAWLFLNIHPAVFMHSAQQAALLAMAVEAVHEMGLPMHRLVFEVTEDVMAQDLSFEAAVQSARSTGCLLALDDFGAGHSNFDRIWRIKPEIVKLDRGLLLRAKDSPHIARVLSQLVSVLHECGALVLLEGIEHPDEALLALDADVDLVQGFAFGFPQQDLLANHGRGEAVEAVWAAFDERERLGLARSEARLVPPRNALLQTLLALQQGQDLPQACAPLLALQDTQLCYLLDEQGCLLGERQAPSWSTVVQDPRYAPLMCAGDARWARRPYFRRAVERVGELQVTRPYLSLHGPRLCVTLSQAFWQGARLRVLCADVDWGEPGSG